MVNDAYIENNKGKRQAWLMIPIALLVTTLIVLFGDREDGSLQPKVLESSPQGMLLELPIVSTTSEAQLQTQWAVRSGDARQQVLQSLSEYAAEFKTLRTFLEIWAEPGSVELEKLAQRMGMAVAQHRLGRVNQALTPPTVIADVNNGALLICAEEDRGLATRMLAALTPYLGGKVTVQFTQDLPAQSMRLYLFGTPYFTDLGQAKIGDTPLQNVAPI